MKNALKAIARAIVKGAIYIYCKVFYRFKVVGKDIQDFWLKRN